MTDTLRIAILRVGWVSAMGLAAVAASCNGQLAAPGDAAPDASVGDGGSDAPIVDGASDEGTDSADASSDATDGAPLEAGCGASQTLCQGVCTDLQKNTANCGACGRQCPVVDAGTDAAGCQAGACPPIPVAYEYQAIDDVAANDTSLFWVTSPPSTIYQASFDGSNANAVQQNLSGAVQMTVDSSNLYWIQDYIGGGTGCSLSQMALDGGATTTLATASDPLVAIALNTTTVFFTTQNTTDTIWGVPIGGGASPVALVTGQKYLSALAADDNHLYWGTQPNGDGELFQATVTGASITQLATSPQSTIESIVVDTTTICFASAFAAMGYPPDANPPVDGIFSTPIGGGPITYLGPTGFPLLLDSTTLYFGQKNALAKMAKDGGAQVTLTRDPSILSYRAALGPTYVYAPASQNQGGSVLATPR